MFIVIKHSGSFWNRVLIFRQVAVIEVWLVGIACHLIQIGAAKLATGRACTGI